MNVIYNLSLGDWVYFDSFNKEQKGYYRVDVIHTGLVDLVKKGERFQSGPGSIKLIELSEKFFELNGFVLTNKDMPFKRYQKTIEYDYGDIWGRKTHTITVYYRDYNSDVYVERPYGDDKQTKINVADIRYVSELQQILRIAGLVDYANIELKVS